MTRTPAGVKKAPLDIAGLVEGVKTALKGELSLLEDVKMWIPTGIPQLDRALGGGLPSGRLTTIIGKKSAGKSSLTVHLLAQIQKMDGLAVGLDVERSNLKSRCELQGLDMSKFILSQPWALDDYETQDPDDDKKKIKRKGAFRIMEELILAIRRADRNALVGIALDSIASSSVASELEGDYGQAGMGKHARVVSQAFRKIMPLVHEMNIAFILVNQLKEKIGVMFGSPNTYIAKNPIDFHSAITLELTQSGTWPKGAADPQGIVTNCYVSKNKVGNPFSKISWVTWFDRGIDPIFETISFLKDEGRLGTTAGWYDLEGERYRRDQLYEKLKSTPAAWATCQRLAKEVLHAKSSLSALDDTDSEVSESPGSTGDGPE